MSAVNLSWAGFAPLHLSWQTLADPAVFERMLAPAEWLASHIQYLRSMVPLPIDGNPPTPLTMVEPKTFYAWRAVPTRTVRGGRAGGAGPRSRVGYGMVRR